MNVHALSKTTNAAVSPARISGTKKWRTMSDTEPYKNTNDVVLDTSCGPLDVCQPEPKNFPKYSVKENNGLIAFEVDRELTNADFYQRIQDLKKEHQATVKLLNQLYSESQTNLNSHVINAKNQAGQNSLEMEMLNHRKNNMLIYDQNNQDDEPITIPVRETNQLQSRSEKYLEMKPKPKITLSEAGLVLDTMWDNFTVDNYSRLHDRDNRRPRSAPGERAKKEWRPVITVPKPFKMTIRDESRKAKLNNSDSVVLEKKDQEEEMLEKVPPFRASEVPPHTYVPLHEEIMERQEQRRRFNKENVVATTLAIQKPFKFDERDQKKIQEKKFKKKLLERQANDEIKEICQFKAQPIPSKVLDPTITDRMIEHEMYREIKKKIRSEQMYLAASLPPRMQAHEFIAREKRQVWLKDVVKQRTPSFRPRTSSLPDFEQIHKKEDARKLTQEMTITTPQPFNLSSSKIRRPAKDREINEGNVTTDGQMLHRPKSATQRKVSNNVMPTRMSESAQTRLDRMKASLAEADSVIQQLKSEERKQKEQKKKMSSEVVRKSMDSPAALHKTQDERLRRHMKEQKLRTQEYNQFLNDVQNRVDQRPLLFEQHNEKVAKQQAEKRYREILRSSGVSDDFIDTKTSSVDECTGSRELLNSNVAESSDDDGDDLPTRTLEASLEVTKPKQVDFA